MKSFYTNLNLKKLIAPLVFFFLFFTWISNVNSQSSPTLSTNRIFAPSGGTTGCGSFDPNVITGTTVIVLNLDLVPPLDVYDSVALCGSVIYEWESCTDPAFPAPLVVHDVAATQDYDPPVLYVTTYFRRHAEVTCNAPDIGIYANTLGPKVTIIVNPPPTSYNVYGTGIFCPGVLTDITTSGSQAGTNYEYTLYKDGALVPGSMQNGTGYGLSWSVTSSSCNVTHKYKVWAKVVSPLCEGFMNDSAMVTWKDVDAPIWTTGAHDLDRSVECNDQTGLDDAQALYPTATDNCSNISYYRTPGTFEPGTCGQTGTYTNTWIAVDACFNTSSTFTQVITITDHTAPTLTGTPYSGTTGTNACFADALTAVSFDRYLARQGYTDNCDQYITAVVTDSTKTGYDCAWTVTYTFTVKDECGNELPGQTYSNSGSDQTPPTGTPPAPITGINACMPSPADAEAAFDAGYAASTYSDNCSGTNVTAELTNTYVSGVNCNWTIYYSFIVKDLCNNILYGQMYSVSGGDHIAPTGTPPAGTSGINACMPSPSEAENAFDPILAASGYTDNCSGVTAYMTGMYPSGDNCGWSWTYTFSVIDECNNVLTGQTYTNSGSDLIPPTGTPPQGPSGINTCMPTQLEAEAQFDPYFAAMGYSDNCSSVTAENPVTVVTGDNCNWVITYTFSIFDVCRNELANQTYTRTGGDRTPPTGTPPPPTYGVNSCMPTQANAEAAFDANFAASGYTDNCTGGVTAEMTMTYVMGYNCYWYIYYYYNVKDACGNILPGQMYTVSGGDQTAPTGTAPAGTTGINACMPSQQEADLAFDPILAASGYTDNCSGVNVYMTGANRSGGNCGWSVTYTFNVIDACNNTLTGQTYTNTGSDLTPPAGTAPQAITGIDACMPTQIEAENSFDANYAAMGYSDNCSGVTAENPVTVRTGDNCNWVVTYTFSIFDVCRNELANQTYSRSGGDRTIPTGTPPAPITGINACMPTLTQAEMEFDPNLAASGYTDNCSGVTAILDLTDVNGYNCSWQVTYMFRVQDACGNILGQQSYTVSGSDLTPPTGTPPASIYNVNACMPTQLEAEAAFDAGYAASGYTDNCSGGVTAELVYANRMGGNCGWSVLYNFNVLDACGNRLYSQYYIVYGSDQTPPTGTAPQGIHQIDACMPTPLEAENSFDAGYAAMGYSDNCSGVNAHMTNAYVSGNNCGWSVTYTFDVVDACNNVLSGQTYTNTGSDRTAPTGTMPAPITGVNACAPTVTEAEAAFDPIYAASTYSDICSGVTAELTNTYTMPYNCGWFVYYTFDVVDACGNRLMYQNYTVSGSDQTAPTGTPPLGISNINSCMPSYQEALSAFDAGYAAAGYSDNCNGVYAELVDAYRSGDNCGWQVQYIFNVRDACYNYLYSQAYTNYGSDQTAPTGTPPQGITGIDACMPTPLEAEASFDANYAAMSYTDNCSNVSAELTGTNVTGDNCHWAVSYTFKVKDMCGNELTGQTYSKTGGDLTPPELTGLPYTGIHGVNACMMDAESAAPFSELDAVQGYTDLCGGAVTAVKTGSNVTGSNCNWTITYTFKVLDVCNNALSFQTYSNSGSDQVPPTFTAPVNTTIYTDANCGYNADPVYTGDVYDEADNCTLTGLNAEYTDNPVQGLCGSWTIYRTWKLHDECYNWAQNQIQIITVLDNMAPSFIAPGDVTIYRDALCNYDADPAITGNPTYLSDNCTLPGDLTISHSDITDQDPICPSIATITRTWRVTDCAGNFTEHAQIIHVTDTIRPTVIVTDHERCATTTYTYTTVGNEFDGSYSDNCGVTNVLYQFTGATTGYQYTTLAGAVFNEGITYVTMTAWDCAQNTGYDEFTITINPLPTPSIIGDDSVCCDLSYNYCDPAGYVGDGFTYEWTVAGGTIVSSNPNSPCISVVWSCNCTSGCITLKKTNILTGCYDITPCYFVTIMPKPAPVIIGNTTVYNDASHEYYSVANCVPGHLYSWTVTGGGIITSVSYGNGVCGIYVNWNYADTCTGCRGRVCVFETSAFGCEGTTCISVHILPVPGAFTLSGQLTYDNATNTPLNGVTIHLLKAGRVIAHTTTATYIDETDPNNPFEVLGYYSFTGLNPDTYTITASTTKPWGGVSATDALLIKLHTIGTINPSIGLPLTNLPLVAANPNLSAPLPGVNATDALLLQLRIVGLVNQFAAGDWVFGTAPVTVSSNMTYNFKALATGDVNKSYVPSIGYKSIEYTDLQKEGVTMVNNSQDIELPIRVNDAYNLGAVTLDLSYNQNLIDVTGLTSKLSGFEYNITSGKIMLAWSNTTPVSLQVNDALVTLKVRANNAINSSDNLFGFGNNSEFADVNGTIFGFNNLKVSSIETGANDYGFNIYPNPFTSNTEIDYNLIESGSVKIALYNVVGQKMETLLDENKAAGNYKLDFNASELPVGVYSCEIIINGQTSNYVKVVKLVKTK